MPLTPGTRLGTYEILAPLGEGGMGEVYRARDIFVESTSGLVLMWPLLAERRGRHPQKWLDWTVYSSIQLNQ